MDYNTIPSPSFVLDETALIKNLKLIQSVAERSGAEIILAFKGFAMWSTFPIVKEYIKGATASSLYEAKLCFEEMKTKAHVYAPAYKEEELEELVPYASHMVFNSLAQFNKHYPFISQFKDHVSCGLRVNPEHSDVKTDLYNPSSPKSRLGILHDHLPDSLPEGIEGLHFHVLCESSSYSLEETLKSFEKKFGKFIPHIKWINFGGGHLMTRKGYDVDHLVRVIKAFKKRHNIHVILEPGSAFAWDTGVLISQVLDIVESRNVKTAILDVSFTAHMPDTLEMPYRPQIVNAKDPSSDSKYLYRLGGISCLAGDFMEEYDFQKELKVGDRIVFKDMIHYTMVKTTMFNGIYHPEIGIWTKEGYYKQVRKFNYNDFKNRLS